jgi:hypothetical protein
MTRDHYSTWWVGPALAALSLIAYAPAAAVTVSVSPADTTVVCGDTLTVRIVTDAFPDLKAYQLIFSFDPAVLQYVGALPGDVLTMGTMQELPDVVPPVDSVWVDCAQLVGSTSGPGVLAYFRFAAAHGTGTSPITCLQVDFRDSWNVQTLPDCVSGIVRVPYCPTPALSETWGRIKTLYR